MLVIIALYGLFNLEAWHRLRQGKLSTERGESMSTRRLEREHIQKVLVESDGNISAAARKLGMHRHTLQRKLAKRAPKY
ncbi:MAG: helix-turn-helix domain-containing protein [Mariprofundus sp.]|nr:helix-turn-helix domain-containing protein [Mariprofundus sp.]